MTLNDAKPTHSMESSDGGIRYERRADLFSVSCRALPANARLVGLRGSEGLSALYQFELGLALPEGVEIDMAALGSAISVAIDRGVGVPISFHGVIAAVELVDAQRERSTYLVTMVPELWHLLHSVHSRIYTEVSIPQIIEAVLKANGIPSNRYAIRLSGRYPSLEHVCQYKESDFAFISRLMEREGIYYFFAHGEDEATLVITDSKSTHERLIGGVVRYGTWQHESGDRQEGLESFTCRMAALPAEVRLTDYDYLKPSLEVRGKAVVQPRGRGAIVVYGDNFRTPDEGERRARIRSEQYLTGQRIYHARGSVYGLRTGYSFELDNHPLASLNGQYLVTKLVHRAKDVEGVEALEALLGLGGDVGYRIELEAIPARVQYRAPSTTPWPRIDGVVDGIVDGPATSPYAQIDDDGRYKVRIFFDESDPIDGSNSTWVRMLQPHGGGTEGFHFPLRKDTEVHIVFLGGDPDRPVIVGVAPNAQKPSKVTAANFSKNVIMTGGSNRMELEDVAGGEYVTTSTPALSTFLHMGTDRGSGYNLELSTAGHGHQFIGGNQDMQTLGYQNVAVVGPQTGSFSNTVTTTIVGALTESFNDSHTREVVGPVTNTLKNTLTDSITGPVVLNAENTRDVNVVGAATYIYGATMDQAVNGGVCTLSVTAGPYTVSVSGAHDAESFTSQSMTAPIQTFTAGERAGHTAPVISIEGTTTATVSSPAVSIVGSATADVNAPTVTIGNGTVVITGGPVQIVGGDVEMSGGNLVVNHSAVTIAGGTIDCVAGVIKLN